MEPKTASIDSFKQQVDEKDSRVIMSTRPLPQADAAEGLPPLPSRLFEGARARDGRQRPTVLRPPTADTTTYSFSYTNT